VRTVKLFRPEIGEFDARFTLSKGIYSAAAVAPHTLTTRVSIAIPSGQRGLLLNGLMLIMRDAAPTTAGLARAVMEITGIDIVSEVREVTATTGAPRSAQVPRGDVFEPGQTLVISTADASTGGTYTYVLSAALLLGPLT
jgi:hypothetical protein